MSRRGRIAAVLVMGLLAFAPLALAGLPLPATPLHSGDSFSAFALTTPTLDGILSAGEWDDADCATQTVINDDGSTSDLTVCVKNDATNLYIAVVITNQDYSDPSEPCFDFINILFDNDHDGIVEVGDNHWQVRFDGATVSDAYNPTGILGHSLDDSGGGGSNDLTAGISHTNPGANTVGDYTVEYSAPLDSGDAGFDFSLAAGDTVGFKVEMADGDPSPSLPCSGPFGGFNWPSPAPTFFPGWADITIAAGPSAQALREFVNGLDPSVFSNPNHQTALLNKIDAVIGKIDRGDLCGAIDKLENDILPKVDGDPSPRDWVSDLATQQALEAMVEALIASLQAEAATLGLLC